MRKDYQYLNEHETTKRASKMTYEDIVEIIEKPNYWRIKAVVLLLYNALEFPCDISSYIANSDYIGRAAILAIFRDYVINVEDGWIQDLGIMIQMQSQRKQEKEIEIER